MARLRKRYGEHGAQGSRRMCGGERLGGPLVAKRVWLCDPMALAGRLGIANVERYGLPDAARDRWTAYTNGKETTFKPVTFLIITRNEVVEWSKAEKDTNRLRFQWTSARFQMCPVSKLVAARDLVGRAM